MIQLDFPTTNNEAEYEALMAGLDLAKVTGVENMVVHCDSQVVTSQINCGYECKNERMKRYLEEVKYRIGNLEVKFAQIPREENECTNHLAKATSAEFMLVPNQVLSFVQVSSFINDGTNMQKVDSECNWTTPLISYLRTGVLPDEKDIARKWKKVQASRFVLIKDVLYKRGFSRPYLRCLGHEEAKLRNERNSRGYLRKPLKGTVFSAQVNPSWVLLPNNAEGCTSLRQGLRQVSEV